MFERIDPKALDQNVFSLIGDRWMLVTAGTTRECNTMTASWGGLGVLWNKPVATCYIRPQRYTREFIDKSDGFTLSFFTEDYRGALALCGSKSGRDIDKVKECGFTVESGANGAPYFQEADLVLVCKKLYRGEMQPQGFMDSALDTEMYPQGDYHKVYIGEIVEVLKKA